jgi:predicted O-linked N-acetylglucosamine transferase (SPINDLY family)
MMANNSSDLFLLAARLVDAGAEPLVFEFQSDLFNDHPAHVRISRLGWQAMGPSQAISYVVDRYLLEHPEEIERVGREAVTRCVHQALGLPL